MATLKILKATVALNVAEYKKQQLYEFNTVIDSMTLNHKTESGSIAESKNFPFFSFKEDGKDCVGLVKYAYIGKDDKTYIVFNTCMVNELMISEDEMKEKQREINNLNLDEFGEVEEKSLPTRKKFAIRPGETFKAGEYVHIKKYGSGLDKSNIPDHYFYNDRKSKKHHLQNEDIIGIVITDQTGEDEEVIVRPICKGGFLCPKDASPMKIAWWQNRVTEPLNTGAGNTKSYIESALSYLVGIVANIDGNEFQTQSVSLKAGLKCERNMISLGGTNKSVTVDLGDVWPAKSISRTSMEAILHYCTAGNGVDKKLGTAYENMMQLGNPTEEGQGPRFYKESKSTLEYLLKHITNVYLIWDAGPPFDLLKSRFGSLDALPAFRVGGNKGNGGNKGQGKKGKKGGDDDQGEQEQEEEEEEKEREEEKVTIQDKRLGQKEILDAEIIKLTREIEGLQQSTKKSDLKKISELRKKLEILLNERDNVVLSYLGLTRRPPIPRLELEFEAHVGGVFANEIEIFKNLVSKDQKSTMGFAFLVFDKNKLNPVWKTEYSKLSMTSAIYNITGKDVTMGFMTGFVTSKRSHKPMSLVKYYHRDDKDSELKSSQRNYVIPNEGLFRISIEEENKSESNMVSYRIPSGLSQESSVSAMCKITEINDKGITVDIYLSVVLKREPTHHNGFSIKSVVILLLPQTDKLTPDQRTKIEKNVNDAIKNDDGEYKKTIGDDDQDADEPEPKNGPEPVPE